VLPLNFVSVDFDGDIQHYECRNLWNKYLKYAGD
jgi:hypothetical protein